MASRIDIRSATTSESLEASLECPWCHERTIKTTVVSGSLKLRCTKCEITCFVTKLPSGQRVSDYLSRKTIA